MFSDSPPEWAYLLHYLLPYIEQATYFNAIGGLNFTPPKPWVGKARPSTVTGVPVERLPLPDRWPDSTQ